MVDHLQGGFEGIQLERAAEHADFNRICIREIDRSISPRAGILDMTYLLGRGEADTVPRRPAVHLALRTAAESKQLCPELFHEVEQTGNRGFLLLVSTAKRQAGDMNVKSTSSGGMAQISHALRFTEYLFPRHFVQVVFQRHGMCNKFKTLIQTAIGFDIQVFGVCIGNIEQLLRVAVYRAALVDFQLYAQMPQALAVEHKVGRIVVVVNRALMLVPAVRAIGMMVVIEVRIVAAQDAATVVAADIVLVKTALAERVVIILNGAFLIDAIAAVITGYCQTIYTVLTEPVALYLKHLADRVLYLRGGQLEREYSGQNFLTLTEKERRSMGLRSIAEVPVSSPEPSPTTGADGLMVRELRATYNGAAVWEGVSFRAPRGQITAITGQNGTIFWDGKPLRRTERRRKAFLIMQDVNLQLFGDSVLAEIRLGNTATEQEALTTLGRMDLAQYADTHPMALSGGQKQRLAVADGCLSGKELLIFDEPTSGLDYGHMLEVSRRLRELAEQGLCVVVITHDGEFLRESGAWTADWLPNDKQP